MFENEEENRQNETLATYNLYILRPSIIIDVQSNFIGNANNEYIKQKVTFLSLPSQVVIAKTNIFNRNGYSDVLNKRNLITPHTAYEFYLNQEKFKNEGVKNKHKKSKIVGVFPEDVLSLSDFNFLQNLGSVDWLKRIKYFDNPFSKYDRVLKGKYQNKGEVPKEIALSDLKKLREELRLMYKDNDSMARTIEYKVIKEPLNRTDVSDEYAGISEEEEIGRQKILLKHHLR